MTAPSARSAPGRVLVTDGEFKHSLGIVRHLADRGHEVHLLARSSRAPAAHSRAVRAWRAVPATGDPAYGEALLGAIRALAPVSVVLVGSGAFAAADALRDSWPAGGPTALPSADSFAIANDKSRTAELARSLGVRVPRERRLGSAADASSAFAEFDAPLVVKSAREEGRKVLRYARSADEAAAAYEAVRAAASAGVLAQEYVRGEGYGFSALYWNGTRVRGFMHRRVREWPPTGGTSACAESVPECAELERAGGAILDALRWHGVAMVEFKGRPEPGGLALMEVNAKFWGSHDVALAAGADIPSALVALLEGRDPGPAPRVRPVRFSWPFGGDLWHGLFAPSTLPRVLWDAVSPAVAHPYRFSDPAPLAYEIAQWVRGTPGAWRERRELR